MLAEGVGVVPTVLCGHENANGYKLVKWVGNHRDSSGTSHVGMLHWLCDNCRRKGIYYAPLVTRVRDLRDDTEEDVI